MCSPRQPQLSSHATCLRGGATPEGSHARVADRAVEVLSLTMRQWPFLPRGVRQALTCRCKQKVEARRDRVVISGEGGRPSC